MDEDLETTTPDAPTTAPASAAPNSGDPGADSASAMAPTSPAPATAAAPDASSMPPDATSTPDMGNPPATAPSSDLPPGVTVTSSQSPDGSTTHQVTAPDANGDLTTHNFINGLPVPPTAQDLDQQSLKLANDVLSKKIETPTFDKLFAKQTTPGKIGTIFGLLLGGAGSGLTHQPNALLEMMNKELQNDFEAQKEQKASANTWLSTTYNHQLQQSESALNAAKLAQIPYSTKQMQLVNQGLQQDNAIKSENSTMNNMKIGVMGNLQGIVDSSPPSIQPAAQAMLDGTVKPAIVQSVQQANQQAAAKLNSNFAMRQNQLRMAGLGDIAQSNEARYLPGVGMAATPLQGADKDYQAGAQNFVDLAQQYQDFVKGITNKDRLDPLSPKLKQGAALASELQSAVNKNQGGVFGESERKAMDNLVPSDPTRFLPEARVLPAIGILQKTVQDKHSNFLKSRGLPNVPLTPSSQGQNAAPTTMQGTSKSGKPIFSKDGGSTWSYTK